VRPNAEVRASMPPPAGRGRRERERADEDAMRWSFQAMNLLSSTERPVRRLLLDRTKLISTTDDHRGWVWSGG